jgi:hypothetical protein
MVTSTRTRFGLQQNSRLDGLFEARRAEADPVCARFQEGHGVIASLPGHGPENRIGFRVDDLNLDAWNG